MHPRRPLALALSIMLLALPATPAQAQNRYKWRDAAGQMHYSDTLTNEALAQGYEVVNSQGLTVRRVARPLTADEKVAAAKAAAIAKAEREAAEERKRSDQQLLAAYPTEADLLLAHKAQLDQLDQIVRAAQAGMQSQEATLADLLGRADELQHRGNPVPKRLADQIKELRDALDQQRAFQANKQSERDRAAASQAVQLAHYRELKASLAPEPLQSQDP